MDRPTESLDSLKELAKYEDQVLDAIAGTPHGLPDPGDPEEWRERLVRDHLGPLIQRDSVSRAGAVQLSSLVGLLATDGGKQAWLEHLRPNLSGAMASRLTRTTLR